MILAFLRRTMLEITPEIRDYLGQKAFNYVDRLEKETGCTIRFNTEPNTWPSSRKIPHAVIKSKKITVCIDIKNCQAQEFEDITVHEITHGFLELKEGFYRPSYVSGNKSSVEVARKIMRVVQDPVVEKRLQRKGFNAIDRIFVDKVANWTAHLKKRQRLEDPRRNESWDLTHICIILDKLWISVLDHRVFDEFRCKFKEVYPIIYEEHLVRLKIITAHNIFACEDNLKAAKELFKRL